MRHHPTRVRGKHIARAGFAAVAVVAMFTLTSCLSGPFNQMQLTSGGDSPTFCGEGPGMMVQAPPSNAGFSFASYVDVWFHGSNGVYSGGGGLVSSAGSKVHVDPGITCFHLHFSDPASYVVSYPG